MRRSCRGCGSIRTGRPAGAFQPPPGAVWLEIGFGGGEHLAAEAKAQPRSASSAASRSSTAWRSCLPSIEQEVSATSASGTGTRPSCCRGFRRPRSIASISSIPIPGRSGASASGASSRTRRSLPSPGSSGRAENSASPPTSTTTPAGRLPGSCARPHFGWTAERPDDWRSPWPDWPGTRYEAKALREGRVPSYLTFVRAEVTASA